MASQAFLFLAGGGGGLRGLKGASKGGLRWLREGPSFPAPQSINGATPRLQVNA